MNGCLKTRSRFIQVASAILQKHLTPNLVHTVKEKKKDNFSPYSSRKYCLHKKLKLYNSRYIFFFSLWVRKSNFEIKLYMIVKKRVMKISKVIKYSATNPREHRRTLTHRCIVVFFLRKRHKTICYLKTACTKKIQVI